MSILAIPEGNAEREAFWIEAVKRWQASGADCMAAFCQREGLPVARFYYWRQRLEEMKQENTPPAFIPVITAPAGDTPASTGVRLEFSHGFHITVHEGFDPCLLRSVVRALT